MAYVFLQKYLPAGVVVAPAKNEWGQYESAEKAMAASVAIRAKFAEEKLMGSIGSLFAWICGLLGFVDCLDLWIAWICGLLVFYIFYFFVISVENIVYYLYYRYV